MSLPVTTERCQGRLARFLNHATLAVECVDCGRRTDIPPDTELKWMQPPKGMWCFHKVEPNVDDVVIV